MTKTATANEHYCPTVSQLTHYSTTPFDCDCPVKQHGHKDCKHIHGFNKILMFETPKYNTTLNHHGKPACDCQDWLELGECTHVHVLVVTDRTERAMAR